MSIRAIVVVLPMLILSIASCSAPPSAEADAARQSLANASNAGAAKYAAVSLQQAEAAQAALDTELKAQEGKLIKSYDRAREQQQHQRPATPDAIDAVSKSQAERA